VFVPAVADPFPVARQELRGGFNPLTFTGATSVAAADFAAEFAAGQFVGVWRFDASSQDFKVFRLDAPAFANSLETIHPRDALLVLFLPGTSTVFERPMLAPEVQIFNVVVGWNQIGFTGVDGTSVVDLFDSVALQSVWKFDQPTASWLAYFPGQADFLQGFDVVNSLDLLFFRVTQTGTLAVPEGV
jgi:hypothetical protein